MLTVFTIVSMSSVAVQAKGGTALLDATLSGPGLRAPLFVALNFSDEFGEWAGYLDVPLYQQTSPGPNCNNWPKCAVSIAPLPHAPKLGGLPYAIVLHYRGTESQKDYYWSGSFDGRDVVYFPESMSGAPLFAAGWYRAGPELTSRLQAALAVQISPPATGDAGLVN
jgi:hypothetical protein